MVSKFGKPIDRTEWDMSPWEVNAYYNAGMNEFVFPLAELLPPILDLNASDGANYGALGATIGHELTHGYDDDGRHYDAEGNLKDWWSASVEEKFVTKANCYVEQANKHEVLPGIFIKGQATLGENLADQGGTKLAYLAYRKARDHHAPAPLFAGLSEDQQFFLSYAQSWCTKMTPEAIRYQVSSDVHPTSDFRVNAVVMNMPEFAAAFNCKIGQKMRPANQCTLW
jgi:putative endopeptidase